jgi:hypothetical protein
LSGFEESEGKQKQGKINKRKNDQKQKYGEDMFPANCQFQLGFLS